MVRCNAMSALVDEESATAAASSASAGVTDMPMPMVRCNAVSWTGEEAGRLRALATRRDLVPGAVTVTQEQAVHLRSLKRFTGTVAEKGFMERRWCESCGRRCRAWRGASASPPQGPWSAPRSASARRTSGRRRRCSPGRATGARTCSTPSRPARGFGDVQGGAGRGVPERGARGREEHGRETALARVRAQGHS
jgi:hypothetical protein